MAYPPPEAMDRWGTGVPVVFVHGSATDKATWAIQGSTLTSVMACSYSRRGTGVWPWSGRLSTQDHADDLREVLAGYGEEKAYVVGSSYGGVVALELARQSPSTMAGAVLCEPPLAPSDAMPEGHEEFMATFEELSAKDGRRAAEYFLRTVLSDEVFEKIPRAFRERSLAMHEQIASDVRALADYRPRYAELSSVKTPILLVGGSRSPEFYGETLGALESSLGNARRITIEGAGHMMHAEAARSFNRQLLQFFH